MQPFRNLTSIRDLDLKILSELDDRDLISFCLSNKLANNLCQDENFWRNRFINKFGNKVTKYKPAERKWKKHYLTVISDLDESTEFPWREFRGYIWKISKPISKVKGDIGGKTKPIHKLREYRQNIFYLLPLGKNICLSLPLGETYIKRNYTNEINFTPATVLELIYNFYQEPLSREDILLTGKGDIAERKLSIMEQKTLSGFGLVKDQNGIVCPKLFLRD